MRHSGAPTLLEASLKSFARDHCFFTWNNSKVKSIPSVHSSMGHAGESGEYRPCLDL